MKIIKEYIWDQNSEYGAEEGRMFVSEFIAMKYQKENAETFRNNDGEMVILNGISKEDYLARSEKGRFWWYHLGEDVEVIILALIDVIEE